MKNLQANKTDRMSPKLFLSIALITVIACLGLCNEYVFAGLDSEKSEEHYQKGLLFYKAGQFKEAEQEFQKALLQTNNEKKNYYKRGLNYYEQGKFKEAEQEFQKAIQATEKENDQHYKRGLILYNQGQFSEAQKEFQKAISNIKKEEKTAIPTVAISATMPDLKPKNNSKYIIGNGDVLGIKVWQNPDLDDQVIVRPDGLISFALVGEVEAAGKTISDFTQLLTQGLREFIKYPQVSVSVNTFGGNRVIILGQVKSPGVYTIPTGKTILEAVGLAGGFTEDAVTPSVILVKGGLEKPEPKRLDLNKALKLADLSDNLVLESEDIVYVPRRFVKDVNYFLKLFLDPVASGLFIRREFRDF